MNVVWSKWSGRFAALSQRERALVALAALAAAGALLFTLWVGPSEKRVSALGSQLGGQQGELATLRAQIASLKSQLGDPDAGNRRALADLKSSLAEIDRQIGSLDDQLVPPQRVGKLLQTVLARHRGLSLVSLRSLPPEPLITHAVEKGSAGKQVVAPAENIYRHGLQIRVAGGYADLAAYVAELERSQQRLLWAGMALTVTEHPRSELTLTVYTLSRDKDWLAV